MAKAKRPFSPFEIKQNHKHSIKRDSKANKSPSKATAIYCSWYVVRFIDRCDRDVLTTTWAVFQPIFPSSININFFHLIITVSESPPRRRVTDDYE